MAHTHDHDLGEVKMGRELGYATNCQFVWAACIDCSKERWVAFKVRANELERLICPSCSRKGSRNINWKGGKFIASSGYVLVRLEIDNPFYPMCRGNNYLLEHRLVMAEHLGRCLETWEIVHHKNRIRSDNCLSNLELLPSQSEHLPTIRIIQELKGQAILIKQLQTKITELEGQKGNV